MSTELTPVEAMRLRMYTKSFGESTSAEALKEAIQCDSIARSMNMTDPARFRFVALSSDLLEYAALLEKADK